jgi:Protein of unknown function (DUF3300)
MKSKTYLLRLAKVAALDSVAMLCVAIFLLGDPAVFLLQAQPQTAQTQTVATTSSQENAPKIPADQLDALVAPIALYPDPLLAQTLAASTYPLEIIQLHQWLEKNKNLKDKELADAVAKQPWDPSIQSMAGLPEVVKRLADDIQWTYDLGNAFLAQQSDVMDAVQCMRKKAKDTGNLKSSDQMKVETKVVETKEVIIVEQSNPQVVYVPSYNPVVVYGPPVYPYPPIYYPPAGYYAAGMAISFGVGVAMGAFWGGGGWGYGCGWGHNDIDINVNNNFNRNANFNRNTNVNRTGNSWQHNSQHRGGAPYSDRSTANRYGGNARGDSLSSRQASAQQQVNRQGGNLQSSNRSATSANRSAAPANRSTSQYSGGGGGGDRVGNRSIPSSSSSGNRSAMSSRSGYNGASTRSSSSRGSSSMRGGGGGGRRR